MFKSIFGKKLVTGKVKNIELQDISNNGRDIVNIVQYDESKDLFSFLDKNIKEYLTFLNTNRKTENDVKLEKLGLTSSKAYGYGLSKIDEDYLSFVDLYKRKYPNNIYIPEKSFETLNLKKIYKNEFEYVIPENVIDALFKFKIDDNDYKIFEYENGYDKSKVRPSPFTYNEVKEALKKSWSIDAYVKEYTNKLERGDITYLGSRVEIGSPEKIKELGKEYSIREHYKAERHFFFLVSNPDERKKTFKEFLDESKDGLEFLVMQPIKGGYLLIANW